MFAPYCVVVRTSNVVVFNDFAFLVGAGYRDDGYRVFYSNSDGKPFYLDIDVAPFGDTVHLISMSCKVRK
jgi:hypothetical protein